MKKSPSKRLLFCATCLLAFGLVSGCKKKDEPPKPTPAPTAQPKLQVKANPAVQVRATSAKVGSVNVPLSFKGKKDPFKPLITPPEAAAPKAPLPGKARIVDALPIQSHEVSQFTVTGIIAGLRENKALVVDPTGKGYVVKQGMMIGNNEGRISRITASSVEVIERNQDSKKRSKPRMIVLPLAKKSKEISR